MRAPTLFDTEEQRTVYEMIALFQQQLNSAQTPMEREELKLAIRSWASILEPVKPSGKNASAPSRATSPPNPSHR